MAATLSLSVAILPGRARADRDALEEAISFAENADFASALAAFEEAESSEGLERDDLIRLYAHRASVHFALGEERAMEIDLARLVSLDRDAALPAAAPPPVREALERARVGVTPTEIHAEARATESGVEVRARAEERGVDLVRRLRAWARRADDDEWRSGDAGTVEVSASPGERVLWYAEALGPGGAIVATEHSRADPAAFLVPAREASAGASDETTWWVVGGGAAAVAIGAAITIAAVVLTSSEPSTTLGGPALVP